MSRKTVFIIAAALMCYGVGISQAWYQGYMGNGGITDVCRKTGKIGVVGKNVDEWPYNAPYDNENHGTTSAGIYGKSVDFLAGLTSNLAAPAYANPDVFYGYRDEVRMSPANGRTTGAWCALLDVCMGRGHYDIDGKNYSDVESDCQAQTYCNDGVNCGCNFSECIFRAENCCVVNGQYCPSN